jgi:flagellar basal body-associated protein FliL
MEARRAFSGAKSYRQLWIILAALMAAAVLGVGGAFIASGVSSAGKAPQIVTTHAAPGTVLRQDKGSTQAQDQDRESNPGNQPVYVPGKSKQTVF